MIFTPLGTATFTGTDGAELGAAWDSGYTGQSLFLINTNRARANPDTAAVESFNTVTPSSDQYAQAEIRAWLSSQQVGMAVRMANPPTYTLYLGLASFFSPDTTNEIYKIVAGAFTQLAVDTPASAWTVSDTLTTAVVGTDLFLFHNGAEVLSASDSAIGGGKAGMWGIFYASFGGDLIVDNFEMGDASSGEAGVPTYVQPIIPSIMLGLKYV